MTRPPLFPSLVGPTCSGKTAVAIAAAAHADLEILSADSRQVYRRLDIGTAKPTAEEQSAAPHHLIDIVDPEETYTAARFGLEARAVAGEVRSRGRVPLLVGGSGLYLRAAEIGLFEGPAADPELRRRYEAEAEAHGDAALHVQLAEVDPETAGRLPASDRVRVIRALEVQELTGLPLSEHHRRHREQAPAFRLLRFGLEWSPLVLSRRIEIRVDRMLETGWVEEVERLLAAGLAPHAPAWNALGYSEIRDALRGKLDRPVLRREIITATRRFAKRQRTWFRALEGVTWLPVSSEADLEGLGERIAERIREAA